MDLNNVMLRDGFSAPFTLYSLLKGFCGQKTWVFGGHLIYRRLLAAWALFCPIIIKVQKVVRQFEK